MCISVRVYVLVYVCLLCAWKKPKYVRAKNFHHPKIFFKELYSFLHVLEANNFWMYVVTIAIVQNLYYINISISHISSRICQPVRSLNVFVSIVTLQASCQKKEIATHYSSSWLSVKCARHWKSYFIYQNQSKFHYLKLVGSMV